MHVRQIVRRPQQQQQQQRNRDRTRNSNKPINFFEGHQPTTFIVECHHARERESESVRVYDALLRG